MVIAATGESIGSADLDAFANRLSHVLKLPDEVSARYDVSSLTHATHAAAPCPVDVKQRMLDWWAPVIHEFYAGTEGAGICCSDDVVRLVAAAGRHDQIAAAAAERFEGLVDTLAIAPAPGLDVRLPAAVIQAIRAVPPTRHADRDGEH